MAFDHNSQVDAIGDAFKCVEVVILRHYRQMLRSRNRAFGTISRVAAPGLQWVVNVVSAIRPVPTKRRLASADGDQRK